LQKGEIDSRVIFTGFLDRTSYACVVRNALGYVETKRSGGTHPSLVEAMGFGSLIVSNDHSANKEVLGESAIYYKIGSKTDLTNKLKWIVDKKNYKKQNLLRGKSANRAEQKYGWKSIVDNYERFFSEIIQSC
jgi:glycosyltransferase involved in cell wall biosynthesis